MLIKPELTNRPAHRVRCRLTDEAQIIAITGSNGASTSTILEGIESALYGESRHGTRRLDSLVRRDAEHEACRSS